MSSASDYYAAKQGSRDAAVRVGWRHELEQAYRFEVALDGLSADAAVLDVGCGLGALAKYAGDTGRPIQWTGIEPRPDFASAAQEWGRVVEAPFEHLDPQSFVPFDRAAAIGVLHRNGPELGALVQFCAAVADDYRILVLSPTTERTTISVAKTFQHYSTGEIQRLVGEQCQVVRVSTTDVCVTPKRAFVRSPKTRFAAVESSPWGARATAGRLAWLAAEVGLVDEARRWLHEATPGDLTEVVTGRVDLLDDALTTR